MVVGIAGLDKSLRIVVAVVDIVQDHHKLAEAAVVHHRMVEGLRGSLTCWARDVKN